MNLLPMLVLAVAAAAPPLPSITHYTLRVELDPAAHRIAVAGTLSSKKGSDFGVARYLASGRLDRSFGGVTKVTVGRGHASHASTIELFGKQLFLTGSAAVRGQADDFAVAALRMPRTAFRCPR